MRNRPDARLHDLTLTLIRYSRWKIRRVLQIPFAVINRAVRQSGVRSGGNKYHRGDLIELKGHHVFFGYYDINPVSPDGNRVLAHAVDGPLDTPTANSVARIGYFHRRDGFQCFTEIADTVTWCWQMGARLRWLPNGNAKQVMFNSMNEHSRSLCSAIVDADSGERIRSLSFPVYDLDAQAKYALSLDFLRLQRLRPGYGYTVLPDQSHDELAPSDNGVWLGDCDDDTSALIFSLDQLAKIEPDESMVGAEHYVNHLCFSPSGQRFMFLHLWVQDGRRHSRLFSSETSNPMPILLQREGPVSHYTWKNDSSLLVFAKVPGQSRLGLSLLNVETGARRPYAEDAIRKDGHPTFLDKHRLLYDGYPDLVREQELFVYDDRTHSKNTLGYYYRPWQFRGEVRCDLHPRFDSRHRVVCIDDVTQDRRCMRLLRLDS